MRQFSKVLRVIGLVVLLLPATTNAQISSQSDSLAKLSSPNPNERAVAFTRLEQIGALSGPVTSDTLLDLLERENRLIESTLRESGEREGISVRYGEDFAEYYARLLAACSERCDKRNPRTAVVLVNGGYSPSSPLAQELARDHGKGILSSLLQRSKSDIGIFRADAVKMLGLVKLANSGLTSAEHTTIRNAVIAATRDENIPVRQNAVETLGKIGTAADIPLLNRIAQQDAGTVFRGTRYPVREQAQEAIKSIRARTK